MSYCRFGPDSDVYAIAMLDGYECLNCKIIPEEYSSWHGKTRMDLFNHFMEHRANGDKVPLDAITRITEEISLIPEEHWENEFNALMARLAAPNSLMKEFMDSIQAAYSIRLAELMNEFTNVLADMDNLEFPPEDEFDD